MLDSLPNESVEVRVSGPNALISQYKRDDIGSGWDLHVSYVNHETGAKGLHGVFGSGFTEQLPSLLRAEPSET